MAKTLLKDKPAVVKLEIPEKGGPFVIVSKRHLFELKSVLEAIINGEGALRGKKTRSFKEFIAKEYPTYAENL